MNNKDISVVLGSLNRKKFLKLTIKSIRKELQDSGLSYEIIVIDGGSNDGAVNWLQKQKDILLILQHNYGTWKKQKLERRSWGYFMNLGFKCAQGKYICMISDDCLIVPGAILNGYKLIEGKNLDGELIGGVAFYWRDYPEEKLYRVGKIHKDKIMINHGLFMKKCLEAVNFIDEVNYKFYYADADLSLKLWEKKFKIIISQNSFIEHHAHANFSLRKRNNSSTTSDEISFQKKWQGKYLEPNLDFNNSATTVNYSDPFKTYTKFKKAQPIDYWHIYILLKNRIKSLINYKE